MTTQSLISALAEPLGRQSADVVAVYFFGSFARGEQRTDSDVDLGVLYREAPPQTLDAPPARLA